MKLGLFRTVILVLAWTVFRFTHIGWSDNKMLVARNRVQLERMIKDTTAAFFAHGMRWKAGELFFMHIDGNGTLSHDDCISFPDGVEKFTVPCVTSIQTLGSVIDQHGRTDRALESQLSRAKGAFCPAKSFVVVYQREETNVQVPS